MQKARCHHAKRMAPTACRRTVSGSLSLPYLGFFSPFPHGTSSLSVSQEYLALPDGAGKFKRGVSDPALLRILPLPLSFSYGAITLCGRLSHTVQIESSFNYVVL